MLCFVGSFSVPCQENLIPYFLIPWSFPDALLTGVSLCQPRIKTICFFIDQWKLVLLFFQLSDMYEKGTCNCLWHHLMIISLSI